MHVVADTQTPNILRRLVIFRPASTPVEFDIMLDVEPSEYLLQFAGYDWTSADDDVQSEKSDVNSLRDRVEAALDGKIKIEETATSKGPFRWKVFKLDQAGSWAIAGSTTNWPVNPFARKTKTEKRISTNK